MVSAAARAISRNYPTPDLSALGGVRFLVTVDTEEEFDWAAPFTRDQHGTTHISGIPRFQELCNEYEVNPCYFVDYPITQDSKAVELFAGYAASGKAEIGAHLHPWVSPPLVEDVSAHNSFGCNLPPELEREKLNNLYAAIVSNIGIRPGAFRAGRYGAGPATPSILADLGIAIDSSARARFDYSAQGGPDYTDYQVQPYWLIENQLLELPLTTVFSGALRSAGDMVFGRWFVSNTARAVLARSKMIERLPITPEGIALADALRAIDLALEDNIPILTLSFHSPSLAPGHTPYVRNDEDLDTFYAWWRAVFAHLANKGVRASSMAEIKAAAGC